MYAWIQCYEQNDLSYLLKRGKLNRYAGLAYDRLQDQIIDEFGVNEKYIEILKARIRIEEMYAKQFKTGDTSNQLLIDLAEEELTALEAKQEKGDLFESLAAMEKNMGFRLQLKEVTVYEFYKYSNFISKQLKAA